MSEVKGDELRKNAEEIMEPHFFKDLFSSNSKYYDALKMYDLAVAQYKMVKNWQKVGGVNLACATIFIEKLKDVYSGANMYKYAADAFMNINIDKSLEYYVIASEIFMENNNISEAAKIYEIIGSTFKNQDNVIDAKKYYQKAADCYHAENLSVNEQRMLTEVNKIE
jgi:tetratricopeptide (TPR) repeat protein